MHHISKNIIKIHFDTGTKNLVYIFWHILVETRIQDALQFNHTINFGCNLKLYSKMLFLFDYFLYYFIHQLDKEYWTFWTSGQMINWGYFYLPCLRRQWEGNRWHVYVIKRVYLGWNVFLYCATFYMSKFIICQ